MSFNTFMHGLGRRVLAEREFDLILSPALADYEFNRRDAAISEWASRTAVVIAFIGALDIQIRNNAGLFISLTLVPACYYVVLLSLWGTFFDLSGAMTMFAWMIVVVSLFSVTLCFWPERSIARPVK